MVRPARPRLGRVLDPGGIKFFAQLLGDLFLAQARALGARRGFLLGEDIDRDLKSLMRKAEAVGDRAHLHRRQMAVDGALPDRIAGLPW